MFVSSSAHHKTPKGKSRRGPGLGELPNIWGFPFITSAMAEANDFNFYVLLAFNKARHKNTPMENVGMALSQGSSRKSRVPFIISTTAEASNFKFDVQLGFVRPIIKNTPKETMDLGQGSSQKFGVPFIITAMDEASNFKFGMKLGFTVMAHRKIMPAGKVGVA